MNLYTIDRIDELGPVASVNALAPCATALLTNRFADCASIQTP